ncbi:MAG: hypothetical protein K0S47_498 [Herbinix sp.]|jgi:hypothetical protein|nr:hypothetical protein [Herbinix sp.]
MRLFNPDKLMVDYRVGVTPTHPIIPRCYTLTHSDTTGELFLTIGTKYALDQTTEARDEVLGEWMMNHEGYFFFIYLYVDGADGSMNTSIRNRIFRNELPLALEAIRYGDSRFFNSHPILDNRPIYVHFRSMNPRYDELEYWGHFSDYDITYI